MLETLIIGLARFRRPIREYFAICDSYYQAIRKATAAEIETIDMARRGVHNSAAELLLERLEGKVETDFATARRLFHAHLRSAYPWLTAELHAYTMARRKSVPRKRNAAGKRTVLDGKPEWPLWWCWAPDCSGLVLVGHAELAAGRDDLFRTRSAAWATATVPINFRTVRALGARFAYLEASDGARWQNERFANRFEAARAAGLRVGAVHRFDPCIMADGQSANFVTMVPRDAALLPPALDLSMRPAMFAKNGSETRPSKAK